LAATWQVLGRLEEDFILVPFLADEIFSLWGSQNSPRGWVRDVGPRVLADSAAGLPAKKLRHRTFGFLHSLKMGALPGVIRNPDEEGEDSRAHVKRLEADLIGKERRALPG
jgi:hypothetical protein